MVPRRVRGVDAAGAAPRVCQAGGYKRESSVAVGTETPIRSRLSSAPT